MYGFEACGCFDYICSCFSGFFVEINLFKASKEKAEEMNKTSTDVGNNHKDADDTSTKNGLADEDANLMIKLKFLTYKVC